MRNRKSGNISSTTTLVTASMAGVCLLGGCSSGPKYPDVKSTVQTELSQDYLSGVSVSQNQNKGIITLTGTVPSQEKKLQAEAIAKGAAPKYTISDLTTVVPPPSVVVTPNPADVAIQKQFDKELKDHHFLDRPGDKITATAKDGVLILSGKVRTKYDKRQAEKLAKTLPNVHQVKNDLTVG
jgi:osmotically-inducible protein OsmY